MTIDELKAVAEYELAFGIHMVRNHLLTVMLIVIHSDGTREVLAGDAEITNSRPLKKQLARIVRGKIATGSVEAVILLSDIYWANLSPEAEKIRASFNWEVKDACDAGLGELHEAVACCLYSPLYKQIIRQDYTRHEDGRITRITLGKRETLNSIEHGLKLTGNISFFEDVEAALSKQ